MNAARRTACLMLLAGLSGSALAAPLDDWRERAAQVRQLAENDAPRAYNEARRLQASLPPNATAADQAQALNLLARTEIYLARTEDAAAHTAQALELAKRANDATGRIEADLNLARNTVNQGRMDELAKAVKDGMTAIDGAQRADLRAEMMLYAAMTYRRFGQVDKAATLAMQALDIAQRDSSPLALAYAEYGMAITYAQSGRPRDAREHFERMLTAARTAHSTWLEGSALLGLADTEGKAGDIPGMLRDTQAAIDLYQRAGGPFFTAHARHLLADFYGSHGQPGKALALLNENDALYRQHHNPIGRWWTLMSRSQLLQTLGRMPEARDDAMQAQALAESIGLPLYRAESARRLAGLAAETGDFRQAYELSAKAAQLTAELENTKNGEQILQLAQRYQDESRQRQLDELNRRNEEQAAQTRMVRTILAASVVVLIITVIFLLRLRRSREEIRVLNTGLEQRVQERTQELRQSQVFLAEAQRIAHIGSWELNLLTNELHWSDEIYRIFEIDPAEFGATYEAFLGAVHPDDRDRVANAYALSLKNRAPYDIEHCLSFPDGRVKYVHERCETVFDADGAPLRSLGTVQDITARKLAERQLKEALELAEGIIHAIPDLLFELDREGRYLNVWAQNPELLAAQKEMLLGRTARDVLSPENADIAMAAIREADETGQAFGKIMCIELPDGKHWFEHSLSKKTGNELSDTTFLVLSREITGRVRMEEALAAREREFRSLAESSPDYVVRYDSEGRCRYYNSALLTHLGLSSVEETLGKRPSEIWPDGRFDNIEQAAVQAVESGEIVTFEMAEPLPSGETDYYHIRVVPERDASGQIVGTIAFGTDISITKRLEISLREQKDFQASLLNAMNEVGLQLMVIENGRITYVSNRKIAAEFGYGEADIAAHPPLMDIIHPDDRAWVMEYHQRRLAGEDVPTSYEVGLVTRQGERREYESAVAIVPGAEPVRLISVGWDITERKLNERKLKEALEFSEGVIHAIPDLLFEVNKEGRYLNIWTHTPERLAAQKEALLGHTVNEMLPPEAATTIMEALREAEEHGLSFGKLIRVDLPQGPGGFELSVSRKPGGTPDDPRFLVLSRDVTERMNYEAAREKALDQAVRLAKTRRDFLSHMSHELRTPLNSILGYTQLMQRDKSLDAHNAEAVGIIRKSGEHLLSLIEDILDLARIEAGRFQLDNGDIALATFLHVVADIVSVQAQDKGIGFFCELAPGLPAGIRGDEKRLRQVLLNLLANAIKFTDRGKVTLRVRPTAPSRLAFEVEDSGVGIPAHELESIFQPFEQSGDVRQRLGGSGLGLSISQQLVRLMGGSITVKSQVGEGSIFRFELELPEVEMGPADTLTDFVMRPAAASPDKTSIDLAAPPREELQTLHRLALLGNMRDIAQYAGGIENLDSRYRPFAAHVRELAESYQSKAILAFVERLLT